MASIPGGTPVEIWGNVADDARGSVSRGLVLFEGTAMGLLGETAN